MSRYSARQFMNQGTEEDEKELGEKAETTF